MISDTLFDSIEEIENYQRDMPDWYESIRPEIEQVKAAMRSLQEWLDAPPEFQIKTERPCITLNYEKQK